VIRALWGALLLLAVAGSLPGDATVLSRGATPVVASGIPDPAECSVAPLPRAAFPGPDASPVPATEYSTLPDAVPTEGELPGGPSADPATAAAVAAAVRQYIACVNTGELLRVLALATDAEVRRFVAEEGPVTPWRYAELATPLPSPPSGRTSLLAVDGARVLPDGRVGVVVRARIAVPPHDTVTLFVFARVGDRWRLDDAVQVVRPASPGPG
jgi:hypothetical protein